MVMKLHFKNWWEYAFFNWCLCVVIEIVIQDWNDYNLRWNASEFGGVKDLRIPPTRIWKPDVLMYNRWDPPRPTETLFNTHTHTLWELLIERPSHHCHQPLIFASSFFPIATAQRVYNFPLSLSFQFHPQHSKWRIQQLCGIDVALHHWFLSFSLSLCRHHHQ